jgi:hypothetical protein
MAFVNLNKYNFYSREKGWCNSEYDSKYYISENIYIHKNNTLDGLTGSDIVKLAESHKVHNQHLIKMSKIYFDWYLYKDNTKIGCSTEYYN